MVDVPVVEAALYSQCILWAMRFRYHILPPMVTYSSELMSKVGA